MPSHGEKRILPYTAEQMYNLVADVARYPEFLPWNSAARVRKMTPLDEGRMQMDADLIISFKVFRERFASRVILNEQTRRIDTEYLDGPFKFLKSYWIFSDHPEGCEVEFFVDFEFKNPMLQRVIGLVFNQAMQRIVAAFEKRASELYSPDTP